MYGSNNEVIDWIFECLSGELRIREEKSLISLEESMDHARMRLGKF